MIRIERLYVAPVKALAMQQIDRAYLDKPGIAGDRAYFVIDDNDKLVTQRECGRLAQVSPSYDPAADVLALTFPDGTTVSGVPRQGASTATPFFGSRVVEGSFAEGDWNEALSAFAGRRLRLVKAARSGSSFDGFPLSMCSDESLEVFAKAAGLASEDGLRFRQNIYIADAAAHQEDEWVGKEVRVGAALLRVKMRDPRCVVTTLDPRTGEPEMNTLKIIASYRVDQPEEVNFGVYCTVAEAGDVRVGDEVVAVTST